MKSFFSKDVFPIHIKEHIFLPLIICAVVYLSFKGLGNNEFWDDEAQVAFFAKNFISTHHLTGWDGRNLFTYRNGSLLNEKLETINPPLDYLLTALSFKLFGCSTWTGRFPFVLAGLFSLVLFAMLLQLEFKDFPRLQRYSMVMLSFSYSFLLNIRQCRYYALAIFFSLLSYYFYKRSLASGKTAHFVFFFSSLFLFFETNYLLCGAFAAALVVNHLLFHKNGFNRKALTKALIGIVLFTALLLLFIVKFSILHRPDMPQDYDIPHFLMTRLAILFYNFRDLDTIGYLPGVLVIFMIALSISFKKQALFPPTVFEWLCLICLYVFSLSLVAPQPGSLKGITGGVADIRYCVVLLPFAACFSGAILNAMHEKYGGKIAIVMALLLLCTNTLSFKISSLAPRLLLPGYIKEVHTDFDTPYKAAIRLVNRITVPDDTIYAVPEYANVPFLFYLGDKIKVGGSLRRNTSLPMQILGTLKAPVFIDGYFPKYIVAFGMSDETRRTIKRFCRGKYNYRCDKSGNCAPFAGIDVFWQDKTRPELPFHTFGPVTMFDPRAEAIYVFKRELRK